MSLSGSLAGSTAPTPRAPPPADLAELDGWLHASEAAFTDLRPGTNKGIVWHGADRQRRPWAVVYLHGFSASRLETAPLAEVVAQALGAHVFYTRLTGHGRGGQAMAEALPQEPRHLIRKKIPERRHKAFGIFRMQPMAGAGDADEANIRK